MAQHISGVYLMLEGNNSEIDAVQYNREPTWSIEDPTNNALRYKDGSGAAHYLYEFMAMNDLTDVDLTGISAGDLVIWDGTSFVPISSGSFGGTQNLSEVLTKGNDATQQDIINVNSISGDDGLIEFNELGSLNVFSPADGNINLYANYHMYINSKNTAIIDATWANGVSEPYYYYATMPNTTISGILYAGEKSIVTKEFVEYTIASIPSGAYIPGEIGEVVFSNGNGTVAGKPIITSTVNSGIIMAFEGNPELVLNSTIGHAAIKTTNDVNTLLLTNGKEYGASTSPWMEFKPSGIVLNNNSGNDEFVLVDGKVGFMFGEVNGGGHVMAEEGQGLDLVTGQGPIKLTADGNNIDLHGSSGGEVLSATSITDITAGADRQITTKEYVLNEIANIPSGIIPPVDSVFSRTGDVVAENGDYNASQITANSTSDVQTELNKKIETLAGTGQSELPSSPDDGMIYYDKALRYPIWYDANTAHWVNSTGAIIY